MIQRHIGQRDLEMVTHDPRDGPSDRSLALWRTSDFQRKHSDTITRA